MPRIFQTSWLAVILATLAFFFIGFGWYGFLFEDVWLAASGLTKAEAAASASAKGPMMLIWGVLITLAQALGVLWVLNLAGAQRIGRCLKLTAWLFLMIAAPLLAYACLYGDYTLSGILVDYGHILLGYLAMAAIYGAFRSRDIP